MLCQLRTHFLDLGTMVMGILRDHSVQTLGLLLQLLHLFFQKSNSGFSGALTVNFHGCLWQLRHHFSEHLLGHVLNWIANVESGRAGFLHSLWRLCPRVVELELIDLFL